MDAINQALLIAGILFLVAIALSAASQRFGIPSLLVFLAVGLLATELPGAPAVSIEPQTAALVGNLALAVILLDGGLRTRLAAFRMVAAPALILATAGVVLTAGIVGATGMLLLGLDWRTGLLLGAIVGSTDAAAVFALLRNSGLRLNERVEATLEVESGANDPTAVFLTIGAIELIRQPELSPLALAPMIVQQLGVGLLAGSLLGHVLAAVVARLHLGESLYALLIQAGGLAIFGLANLMGGSGFLAIYLAGMVIAHRRTHVGEDVLRVSDGFAWLAQAGMFLLLGIITDVNDLLPVAFPALLVALVLMLAARPVATAACLVPFGYPPREIAFIGWMGLRGAVPIVLALFPLLAGVPSSAQLFHIAFFIVLLSLLLQGGSLRRAAALAGFKFARPGTAVSSASLQGGPQAREVVQFLVAERSAVTRRAVEDLAWPRGMRLIDVVREGQVLERPTALRAGDLVTVVSPAALVAEIEGMFRESADSGELIFNTQTRLGDLSDYYGIGVPLGCTAETTLGEFARAKLRGRPAAGDVIRLGAVELVVRESAAGRVRSLGLRLRHRPPEP
jgi:cell volume regulation protein A